MKVQSTIYRAKTRGIEDAVEWWKPDHDNAMSVRDVEDLVRECLGIRDFLKQWLALSWQSIREGNLDDCESVGRALEDAFKNGAQIFQTVRECIVDAEHSEYTVENSAAFDEAEKDVVSMQADFEREWPFMDMKVLEKSIADYKAGRYRSAKEILDEMQHSGCGSS
jgi:hypothetical protein